ncbi:hypothetical protein [Streptomyces sp. YIM S03343]
MNLRLFAGVSVLVVTCGLSACSSSSGDFDDSSDGNTTTDVRRTRHSVLAEFQKGFVKRFATAHPDIKVQARIQEWGGIGKKAGVEAADSAAQFPLVMR